jgi:hypothetical protein
LAFVEKILDESEIDDAELESGLETLAKEYNKQDGKLVLSMMCINSYTDRIRRDDEGLCRRFKTRI